MNFSAWDTVNAIELIIQIGYNLFWDFGTNFYRHNLIQSTLKLFQNNLLLSQLSIFVKMRGVLIITFLTFVALFATESESVLMVYRMPRNHPTTAPQKLERSNSVLPFGDGDFQRLSFSRKSLAAWLKQHWKINL